jgi:polyhydroxybutyrate depolymerase
MGRMVVSGPCRPVADALASDVDRAAGYPAPLVRRRALSLACAVLALGLAALAIAVQPAGSARAIDPGAACAVAPGTSARFALDVPGQGIRQGLVHLPARRVRGPLPLLVAFHGAYRTGALMEGYSGLSRLADRAGFAVVYPDAAAPRRRWTLAAGAGPDDLQFVDLLLDRMLAGRCLDRARVSAVGVSNGGGMAARLACADADRLAAIVSVAGGYSSVRGCAASGPVAVLEIHGTADPVVPYRGGAGDVRAWLGGWVRRDGCAPRPRTRVVMPRVTRLDWTGCREGTSVAHLAIAGGQHAWPGAEPPDPGPAITLSATAEAWRFLASRRRAH